ncbi:MAG: DUF3084 domain-containing protein [Candidatus Margulisiibacteriota bacterium]|nr:DUF3084 domain-containing protein [Candidatus Margulisiibacteriota bacterium]
MFTFGARIILFLIVVGGVVAIIGDYIGRSIGRKRLSLFKLRPRSTAAIFTVITGILIALSTLGILLVISQDARTALFGLEDLRTELSNISSQRDNAEKELVTLVAEKGKIDEKLSQAKEDLDKSRNEIENLKRTKNKLSSDIKYLERKVEASRKGKVLFKVNETLLLSVIQAGPEKDKIETGLKQILSAADSQVRSYGVKSDKHLIFIKPDDFNRTVSELSEKNGEVIVKLIATRNTLFGEEVAVRFLLSENVLVYKTGETVTRTNIAPSLSIPGIEQEIKKLLTAAHQQAKNDGVIPDPAGSLGSVPYSEIFALAKKINSHKKGATIKALARKNIYTMGPLEIKFMVYYQ